MPQKSLVTEILLVLYLFNLGELQRHINRGPQSSTYINCLLSVSNVRFGSLAALQHRISPMAAFGGEAVVQSGEKTIF
jgi:hypothetical protein